jgi:hypothetical protein
VRDRAQSVECQPRAVSGRLSAAPVPDVRRGIDGQVIGEVQRGGADGQGLQHCLLPPSTHPATGERYVWLVDPVAEPLVSLSSSWRAWLAQQEGPGPRGRRDPARNGTPRPLTAENTSRRQAAALAQPGAVRRASGSIKFPCPQCTADGYDLPGDNAGFVPRRRWACAWAAGDPIETPHDRRAIWRVLDGEAAGT